MTRTCSSCKREFESTTLQTCETCRERYRRRYETRTANTNDAPRRRGRRTQKPAAYKSELNRLKPLDLGRMDQLCEQCGAKHWEREVASQSTARNKFYTICCKNGAVALDKVKEPPQFLLELLSGSGPQSNNFRNNIRQYNSAFAFTSLRCELHNENIPNMPFQVHGQLYHSQGPLTSDSDSDAAYAQLYIFDPMYAAGLRTQRNPRLDSEILRKLTMMLHTCNPFIDLYKTAHELLNNSNDSDETPFVRISPAIDIELMMGHDRRTENLPTSDEVAAIIPNETSAQCFRDIRIYNRNQEGSVSFTQINQNHALYMPLHYTLLFPNGDYGWHWGLRMANDPNARVTQRSYYRYRLHERNSEFPTIFFSKRLFQQYIVDIWAVCDQNKLDWIKHHQSNIRADLYTGVEDALINDDLRAEDIGRRFILPSSYVGGPRFMAKQYQDSMAIVRQFGAPSLFITFTANPKWKEIQEELYPGQTASDRPDLVARVFDMKVKELLNDLKRKNIFGKYRGLVRTIEYQKRGLPHLHLLLFLDPQNKIETKEIIDQVISAEIPNKDEDPELYEIITKNMIHGPCGIANPKSPCMIKNTNGQSICSKSFPKPFCNETIIQENGYPLYQRKLVQNPSSTYSIPNPINRSSRFLVDNSWVVPYNPYLSKKFKAHINVECCQGVQAIKYINKYVYKGSDRTTMRLSDTNDEISRHLQGRYIGPTEAFWRLFEYKIHEEDPTVTTLSLHLPNQQPVFFPDDASTQVLAGILLNSKTMLMAYFEYNRLNSTGRQYLYQDYPRYFTFDQKLRVWKLRQRGFAIGRIPYCSPTCGERFYMRLLLINVSGSTSFEDLRTVRGTCHSTFKDACLALHLIQDDREWFSCFREASIFSSGESLRCLFIVALTFGGVTDAQSLWLEFKDSICDDLSHKLLNLLPLNEEIRSETNGIFYNDSPFLDYGIYLIMCKLEKSCPDVRIYNMPHFLYNWKEALRKNNSEFAQNSLIEEQLSFSVNAEKLSYESKYSTMNDEQKIAFNKVIARVQSYNEQQESIVQNHCFFLHGPAGTGKTYVYSTLCNYLRSQKKIVLCVASSGIAALLLPGGRTSHSRFKIPITINETSLCGISKNCHLAALLRATSLIIWDEVPMQNKLCFEAFDRTLRDIKSNNESLFGSIPVILGGDFAQIPPVVKNGDRPLTVNASIKQSYIWKFTEVLMLQTNMRVTGLSSEDIEFKKWLYDLNYNPQFRNCDILIPEYIYQTKNIDDIISRVYPPAIIQDIINKEQLLGKSAILTTTNANVDSLNTKILNMIPGEATVLHSADDSEGMDETDELHRISTEYLNTLIPTGFPPAKLTLKVGCIVMLLRNLNPEKGLCNGTRLIVKDIGEYVIRASKVGCDDAQGVSDEFIPRITLHSLENQYPFILIRKQFPIKLCFAMTINKSQGQSLQNVGIDLRESVFMHGQLYVALSRSTSIQGISIVVPDDDSDENRTHNIVYPELLIE